MIRSSSSIKHYLDTYTHTEVSSLVLSLNQVIYAMNIQHITVSSLIAQVNGHKLILSPYIFVRIQYTVNDL